MNIFFLHQAAPMAAAFHCDKHVGKMLLESAQLLATAHHLRGHPVTYKPTHVNHPCAEWVRASSLHYRYVRDLALALGREFRLRFGKEHATLAVIQRELMEPPAGMPGYWEHPPLCMPDEFKVPGDAVESYRRYYCSKQDRFAMKWTNRHTPAWFVVKELSDEK